MPITKTPPLVEKLTIFRFADKTLSVEKLTSITPVYAKVLDVIHRIELLTKYVDLNEEEQKLIKVLFPVKTTEKIQYYWNKMFNSDLLKKAQEVLETNMNKNINNKHHSQVLYSRLDAIVSEYSVQGTPESIGLTLNVVQQKELLNKLDSFLKNI